jgi:hypothetical protein
MRIVFGIAAAAPLMLALLWESTPDSWRPAQNSQRRRLPPLLKVALFAWMCLLFAGLAWIQ